MSAVTVFLIVLIVSLGIGNALFSFMKRRNSPSAGQPSRSAQSMMATAAAASPYNAAGAPQPEAPLSTAPMGQKIELAHARLQALESRVKSMQGIYGEGLKAKVERLESFRDTANAEIIAVKEIIEEMQKRAPYGQRGKAQEAAAAKDISTEQMKRLIYRSSQG